MKADIRRMFWRMILGGLAVIAAGVGAIRAVYGHDDWAQLGWTVVMIAGVLLAVSGLRRGSKLN